MTLNLTLPLPPSANTYYRNVGGRMLISKAGRDYKLLVRHQAALQNVGDPVPVPTLVSLRALVFFPKRPGPTSGDLDNRLKPLKDALANGVAYDNDYQVVRIYMERHTDAKNPRVEVCVEVLK